MWRYALVPYGASLYDTRFRQFYGFFEATTLFPLLLQTSLLLVAQAEAAPAPAQDGGGSGFGLWPAVIASLVAMYLIMIRPERRRERELQQKLEALKKNDRVITTGGIYGVVTNVRREVDEVTLKVDEDSNTKLRVTLRSIARVVEPAADDSAG